MATGRLHRFLILDTNAYIYICVYCLKIQILILSLFKIQWFRFVPSAMHTDKVGILFYNNLFFLMSIAIVFKTASN